MKRLDRRVAALQKTATKYQGKPCDWAQFDCVRLLRSHLVANGHKGLPKLPRYSSPLTARKALKAAGFDNLEQLLDSILPRIAPAAALPGDIILLKGEGGWGSITIKVSARKVMGWHGSEDALVMMTPHQVEGAWRV